MPDQELQTYHCRARGHQGETEFEARAESFYRSRGEALPKWCPSCKAWKSQQAGEHVLCKSCGQRMIFTAKLKWQKHIKEGVFILPDECDRCKAGDRPPIATLERKPSEQKDEIFIEFQRLKEEYPSFPLIEHLIETDVEYYAGITVSEFDGSTSTRNIHFDYHLPDSPNSRVGPGRDDKTASAFCGKSRSCSDGFLDRIAVAAVNTDSSYVIEYRSKTGEQDRIVKLTFCSDGKIERTIIVAEKNERGYQELITSFSHTMKEIRSKLKSENWKHHR